jgi:CIC family chloride channel protein
MCGICLAGLGALAMPIPGPDQLTLAVVGMSACLGAVVRAPVTGILIVFEMTHQFSLVPALMLGALVSQALSRKLSRLSFYEEILVQDGHRLEHVVPPRDLQSWQQLPVSAIANFQPVFAQDCSPEELKKLLQSHPYQRFPVVQHGTAKGILMRKEAEAALRENRPPNFDPMVACSPNQTIRELQGKLIESASLMAVVLNQNDGKVLGLVTLHDLLRAQATFAREGAA